MSDQRLLAMSNSGEAERMADSEALHEITQTMIRAIDRLAWGTPDDRRDRGAMISRSFSPAEKAVADAYFLGFAAGRRERNRG